MKYGMDTKIIFIARKTKQQYREKRPQQNAIRYEYGVVRGLKLESVAVETFHCEAVQKMSKSGRTSTDADWTW